MNEKEVTEAVKKNKPSKSNSVIHIKDEKPKEPIVVGIGASAGGLEALRLMLPNLPEDANISYVIAQHLDPKHSSMLVQLLARNTNMQVREITHGQIIHPNTIYITPPNREVRTAKGRLQLSKTKEAVGPKPSVDTFFTSLAEEKAEKAVGIILSGTGSDGAHGIRAIKAHGGITIVQEESTAKYNGMPRAAIETGHVDLLLPPEKIGSELPQLLKFPRVLPKVEEATEAPDDLQTIFKMLLDKTNCDFSQYKLTTINRRIERRMAVNKIDNLKGFVQHLRHSTRELDLLYKDILISVTSFFRDSEAYKALSDILSRILDKKKAGDSIRIWVPGCATGEEAYSIAILLAEHLGDNINAYNIQVFATDIDDDAIAAARKSIYPEATVENVKKLYLKRYFIRRDNLVQVAKSIRELVIFARQNLVKDPPFLHLDLISCRNILIYFQARLQKQLIPMFHYSLNPDGYLFLGKHESIGKFEDLFRPEDKKWRIYQRRKGIHSYQVTFGTHVPANYQNNYLPKTAEESQYSILELMHQAIAENYDPKAVAIDDRMDIIYIRGDVSSFLTLQSGEADLNILNLVRDEIRLDLRALIHQSRRDNSPVARKNLKLHVEEDVRPFNLYIRPLSSNRDEQGLSLVLFEEKTETERPVHEVVAQKGEPDPRVEELEQELVATRQHLQTTVEELETANEELQSLNEELQSANEELQSSNEELETSNEELQSTNEELITVNEELQIKSSELATVNTDLVNIQNSIEFPMLVVDKNLRVTRFTPHANQIFRIREEDIGQVIMTIPCNVDLPSIRQELLDVMKQEKTYEKKVGNDDEIYWMRIRPYYSEHKRVAGAILTFINQTDVKKAELALFESEERFRKIFEEGPLGMAIVSLDNRLVKTNAMLSELLGYSEQQMTKLAFSDIIHSEDSGRDPKLVQQLLEGKKLNYDMERRLIKRNKESIWIHQTTSLIHGENDKPLYCLTMIEDITRRRRAEKVIEESLKEKEELLNERNYRVKSNLQFISSLLNFQHRRINDKKSLDLFKDLNNRIKIISFILDKFYQSKSLSRINLGVYIEDLTSHLFFFHNIDTHVIEPKINVKDVFLNIDTAVPCSLIISELIANSLKHAFSAKKKAEIRLDLKPEKNKKFQLDVSDSGVGFPKQLDFRSTDTVGLQLVCALVDQLEGTIELEVNGGTTFKIQFAESKYKDKVKK